MSLVSITRLSFVRQWAEYARLHLDRRVDGRVRQKKKNLQLDFTLIDAEFIDAGFCIFSHTFWTLTALTHRFGSLT